MGCLKVCGYLSVLLALLVGGSIYYGRKDPFYKGTAPILLEEVNFRPEDIPNLEGKIIVITGANAGLGKSSAKLLAKNKATVVMACRSMTRCKAAKQEIVDELTGAKGVQDRLVLMELDLGSFKSVKNFATQFQKEYKKINSLMLNAGVMHSPFGLTQDGLETQVGVNHVRSSFPRVVFVELLFLVWTLLPYQAALAVGGESWHRC